MNDIANKDASIQSLHESVASLQETVAFLQDNFNRSPEILAPLRMWADSRTMLNSSSRCIPSLRRITTDQMPTRCRMLFFYLVLQYTPARHERAARLLPFVLLRTSSTSSHRSSMSPQPIDLVRSRQIKHQTIAKSL